MSQSSSESVSENKSTNVRAKRDRDALPLGLRALREGLGVLSRVTPDGAARVAERVFLSPRRFTRPAVEHELLARARHVLVPSDDGPIATWEWGDTGPHVLLVHGWEGRGAQLGALAEPLVALGFRVVTFDAPGHGDTVGSTSSLFHFARAIRSVATAFGPIHAVVTHSMGGAAAAWALHREPFARRVAMVAPPIDLRDFTRNLSRVLGLDEDVRSRIHQRLGDRFGIDIASVRTAAIAPTMRMPLLVIHDENDRDVPIRCGEEYAAHWPGATLVRTHGLGHHRILRDEAVVRALVRFVADDAPHRASVAA
jgi:pimeloyl-ACP methyl ester carboxylesterase